MEVIRLELWQDSAVFRTPYSMETIETYPLPPYSTVLGFIHNALDAKETIRGINLSIQGEFSGVIRDFASFHKFGEKKEGKKYPILITALFDLHLLIHISMPKKELKESLFQALKSPKKFFHLGRGEDLITEMRVSFTNVENKVVSETLPLSAYIPFPVAQNLGIKGVYYLIPNYYILQELPERKRKKEKIDKKTRVFNWSPVIFVEKGSGPEKSVAVPTDESEFPVWWMNQTE